MMKSISLSFLFVLICLCVQASAVQATPVTLTGGNVTLLANVATINLTGDNFNLSYLGDAQGSSNPLFINTATLSLGSPNMTFQGISSSFFRGSLSFNNSSLTGSIVAFGSMQDLFLNQNPVFSVEFNGQGFVTTSNLGGSTQTQFSVTAVPEPATILQLFVGLLSSGGLIARRRVSHAKPQRHNENP